MSTLPRKTIDKTKVTYTKFKVIDEEYFETLQQKYKRAKIPIVVKKVKRSTYTCNDCLFLLEIYGRGIATPYTPLLERLMLNTADLMEIIYKVEIEEKYHYIYYIYLDIQGEKHKITFTAGEILSPAEWRKKMAECNIMVALYKISEKKFHAFLQEIAKIIEKI